MNKNKSLIFSAFAHLDNTSSGVNIRNTTNRRDIYYRNIVVALVSAKRNNPDCDVALVSNQDVPSEYLIILSGNNVRVVFCSFDSFRFKGDYPWALAYYKLCAFQKVLGFEYANYLMIDSDVFVQNSISMLWNWTPDYLVMFDTSETTQRWQNEMHAYLGNKTYVTHWGGEFIAGSHEIMQNFIEICGCIFNNMQKKNFTTIHGDEFIESIAIHTSNIKVKHAGLFMYRFWTRTDYRVQTVLPVGGISVLHVPAEKEYGMLKIFKYISLKGTIPSQRKVQRILHLHSPAFFVVIKRSLIRFKSLLKK